MHVVKFIIGFIGGAVGFAISSAIFYLCIIRPIIVIGSGQIFPETVESVLYTQVIAVILAIAAVYIGASWTPKTWKWGLRVGAITPPALGVLPFLSHLATIS